MSRYAFDPVCPNCGENGMVTSYISGAWGCRLCNSPALILWRPIYGLVGPRMADALGIANHPNGSQLPELPGGDLPEVASRE